MQLEAISSSKQIQHTFSEPFFAPDRCAQHRNSSIFIKHRKISTCCFVCELLNVKTFARQMNHLSDCLSEINLCCLLTAWTQRSLIMSHSSKQLHVSQSRTVLSGCAGAPPLWHLKSFPSFHSQWAALQSGMWQMSGPGRCEWTAGGEGERDGFRGEMKRGRTASGATAEESRRKNRIYR